MYKVGDEVISKKTLLAMKTNEVLLSKNKKYTIVNQLLRWYEIRGEISKHTYTADMIKENFYTQQEFRKLKLKKLLNDT